MSFLRFVVPRRSFLEFFKVDQSIGTMRLEERLGFYLPNSRSLMFLNSAHIGFPAWS